MDSERKGSELARRMTGSGGYDFYRTLNLAISAHIRKKTQDEIDDILQSSLRPQEIEYNTRAFQNYIKKFGKKKGLELFGRKASVKLANGQIEIVCSPLFSHSTTTSSATYQIWATRQPELDKSKASIGCYLLSRAFPRSNETFKMLDLVQGREFSTINNSAAAAVEAEARTISWWLEQHS
jgi:TPP-dependent indolepyruvate ferredoxin oxidoreductase alpha subunit